ncbi:nucleotide exchange factor SIL1-like [Amphiura filiformis]|uniref:nucleotide exchange factor SIL1-like n=1 Tax=Amphiura filiformis TaxID=82378 RepID=UPI003B220016
MMALPRRTTLHAFHLLTLGLFLLSCYLSVIGQINVKGEKADNKHTAIVAVDAQEDDSNKEDEDGVEIQTYDEEDMEVFQPTSKWQTIKAGQAIPAGLHVQINLETGLKEAKLMEGDDGSRYRKVKDALSEQPNDGEDPLQVWSDGEHQGVANTEHPYFTKKELKEALKKFKASQDDVKDKEAAEKLRSQYRPIDELKKDYEQLKVNIESDIEIMQRLVKIYNASDASLEERQMALHDLEYYAHQIDNARDLVSIGAFHLIIQALNDTEQIIRQEAAFVMGSAVQSNPHVQVVAVDGGALQQLLRLISSTESFSVRKKAMYAMSALLRHFPYAQLKFLQLGGLSSFSTLFKETDVKMTSLKVKAVTLLHDMLLEYKLITEGDLPSDEVGQQRLNQYKLVNLLPAMLNQGWCDLIPTLLDVPDHDAREKILLTMELLLKPCQDHYQSIHVIERLSNLKEEYEQFASEEKMSNDGDEYFQGIFHLVGDIITRLQVKS